MMNKKKTLTWELKQNNDRIALHLVGELSRDTLLPLWEQRASFLANENIEERSLEIDLSEVVRIDSAGVALLCNLIQEYNLQLGNNSAILLENAPHQLITLADLYGLSRWLAPHIQNGKN